MCCMCLAHLHTRTGPRNEHRIHHERNTHTRAGTRTQTSDGKKQWKKSSVHFLLFHFKRNINFMSAVILIVMRPVFSTHYLSQAAVRFVRFPQIGTPASPLAAAELSTKQQRRKKCWRGANALLFHNPIVIRIRHNVNVRR